MLLLGYEEQKCEKLMIGGTLRVCASEWPLTLNTLE